MDWHCAEMVKCSSPSTKLLPRKGCKCNKLTIKYEYRGRYPNAFLVPVLAVGLMLVPFWYIKLTAGSFKKDVAAELETALSVITTAYLRTENFQQAVEENVRYLHHPVQDVFQRFLTRIKHIDPDMDAALSDLKDAIDNEVWQEWCDAVMACQTDRSLKSTLTPIVSKLSDMRVVNAELENLVFGPRKEFITMAILVLINIPLVRFINIDWFHTLVDTIPGQMVIAICMCASWWSVPFMFRAVAVQNAVALDIPPVCSARLSS